MTEKERTRRDFSDREIAYIRAHAGVESWSQIARDLGRLYPGDNGGSRSRGAVYKFATTDEEPLVSKVVKIPKPLHDRAIEAGIDLNHLIASALTSVLKRKCNKKIHL